MSKYDPLRNYLEGLTHEVTLPFAQINDLVPGGLPQSAYNHDAWWANEEDGQHVQARAWLDAGYRVSANLTAESARFSPIH